MYRTPTPAVWPCNNNTKRCLWAFFSDDIGHRSVSSTFPAPTFTAASFSLSWPSGKGRRHSFSGNVRRSPGRREREESPVLFSLVAAGRREGTTWPWEDSCRIFAPFSISLCSFSSLLFTADLFDAKRRYLPSHHLPASRTHIVINGSPTRVSSVPFCVVNQSSANFRGRTFSGVHVPWD